MTNLDPPKFANTDAQAAYDDTKAAMELLLDRPLFPAQPETLLVGLASYLRLLSELNVQHAGEQNTVNYANEENLDQVGAIFGEYGVRLQAQPAIVTLEFTLPAPLGTDKLIPAGTRARTEDNLYLFATDENLTIAAGQTTGTVTATAQTTGTGANGYSIGQIVTLFDAVTGVSAVTNITTSNSGSDIEDDDRFRKRLKLAPNAFTTGGTPDSYKFYVFSADPTITSVSVRSPSPSEQIAERSIKARNVAQRLLNEIVNRGGTLGTATAIDIGAVLEPDISIRYFYVEVYILTKTGAPSSEIILKVQNALNAQNVRPLNDEVVVKAPTTVGYSIAASVTALASADTAQLQAKLDAAAQAYASDRAQTMGGDVVASQIIDTLQSIAGVHEVVLNSPAGSLEIAYNERAVASSVAISLTGAVDES